VRKTGLASDPTGARVRLTRGQWAVLALLIERANTLVSGEAIKDRVWSGVDRNSTQLLHTYISTIRRLLEKAAPAAPAVLPRLRSGGYRLDLEPWQVDALRLEWLARAGREAAEAGELLIARDWLQVASDLAPAEPEAVTVSVLASPYLARFEEIARDVRTRLVDVRLALGEHAALVPDLAARLTDDPIDVGLANALMVALYRCGRARDALLRARSCQEALAVVGLNPGPLLQRTELAILRDESWLRPPNPEPGPAERSRAGSALVASWGPRHLLPWEVRDVEFALVAWQFGAQRLSLAPLQLTATFPAGDQARLAASALRCALRVHAGVPGAFGVAVAQKPTGSCPGQLVRAATDLARRAEDGEIVAA